MHGFRFFRGEVVSEKGTGPRKSLGGTEISGKNYSLDMLRSKRHRSFFLRLFFPCVDPPMLQA